MSIVPETDGHTRLPAFIHNFMTTPLRMNWMKTAAVVKVTVQVPVLRGEKFLIWSDKVALGVAAAIAAAAFFVWLLAAIALKSMFDGSFNRYMLDWTADAELTVVLPLWLGLRTIHYIRHRRSHPQPVPHKAAEPAEPPKAPEAPA